MGVSFNCVLNQDFITMLRFGFFLSTLAVASLANQRGQPTSGTTGSQSNPFAGNPNPFAGQPNPNGFPFAAPAPRPMDPTMMVLMMTMMGKDNDKMLMPMMLMMMGGNNGDMTLPMMMMLMDQDGDDNMMLMMMVMMMNGGNNQDMLIPMMLLMNNNKKDEMKR